MALDKPLLAPGITETEAGRSVDAYPGGNYQDSFAAPLLLQYWTIARRWKWVILGIVAAALLAGVIATLVATPQYEATAQIEISRDQKNPTNVEGLESATSTQDQEFYQTQYTLLQSRTLAERVARQLNLGNSEDFYAAHGVDFAPSGSAADRVRNAAGLLLKHVEIVPVSRSRLVDVRYTSASPDMSARVANAWTQNFIQASMDRRFASTNDARQFLEARLAELARTLEDAERQAVTYASKQGIVALSTARGGDGKTEIQQTLVSSQLEALSNELAKATAERMAAEAMTYGKVNTSTIENPTVVALRQRRAEVSAEYSRLMEQFEPGYPAAAALQRQLATLDQSIAAEEARINRARGNTYAEASRREATLRAKVDELTGRLDEQTRDQIQYNIFRRNADTTRQLYDSLLQRYKEIGVAGVAANNIAIVDPAELPTSPSSPSLPRNLLVALILGLGIAVVVVIGLEQIDEGLREPADVRRLLQLPLLGAIPDQAEGEPLELLADPKSELSEAYLSVRSNLAFTTDHGLPRSLMVTSSRPAEGKSTSAFAIATMLARTGKRTLIIDADMRSPSIHGFAGVDNRKGLSNFLTGDNDWRALVHAGAAGGLDLMSAGPMPPSAAELLSSDRMTFLVKALGEHYDVVVVDSPPLLGLADAPLLSRAVEGCVFVVESGGVAVRGLRSALGRLQLAHAHLFGVVMTKLAVAQSGYGYGYGYGYGGNDPDQQAASA